jgi:tyrosine-specific transport protein
VRRTAPRLNISKVLNTAHFAVICAYLGGDLARIWLSILVGSLVPLLSFLVWDDIALGPTTDLHGFDILEMLKT